MRINNAGYTDTLHIQQVSDYLKHIGMRIMVFMLNKENIPWVTVCGSVRNFRDNGQSLILKIIEHLKKDNHFSWQDGCTIALEDIHMVKILDISKK